MSRRDFSDKVISEIDKDRRSGAQKARDRMVTQDAYLATTGSILRIPANDRARHCEGALDAIRDQLTALSDAAFASSTIAAKAYQPIYSIGAKARAEQAFDKLTTAANDGVSDA